jgi:c-di-GMP-binding flagellar brake protein YcgR
MSSSLLAKVLRAKQKGWHRRYPRYRADFPLAGSGLRENGYFAVQGRCSDIGEGGMGVVLTSPVQPGEVLALEFRFPNSEEVISIRAIVRYRNGFAHGLEFLGVTPGQQSAINGFCAALENPTRG